LLLIRLQLVVDFVAMMSEVVGGDVIHDECMVRDGNVCRFKFKERP